MMTAERKQELIGSYRRSDSDTGSPEVQIALLTERINVGPDKIGGYFSLLQQTQIVSGWPRLRHGGIGLVAIDQAEKAAISIHNLV